MRHRGGIFATTSEVPFERVAGLVDWRGEVSEQHTVGGWTLTASGNASIARREDASVALHGSPDIDGQYLTATDLVECFSTHGKSFLEALTGSFACIVVDRRAGRVIAVRDFVGTKPLLWGEAGGRVALASEPLAVPLLLGEFPKPDETTIDRYLKFQGNDLRRTMVDGAFALPPNSISTLTDRHLVSEPITLDVPKLEISEEEARSTTRAVFDRAVRRSIREGERAIAAASAGVDSSVVAVSGLSQNVVESIITTRTVGLTEWDETPRAALIAERYGVAHHVVDVPAPDTLHRISDQILVHGPCSPTAWLSIATIERVAREGADVLLEGHLGDEWLTSAGGPVEQSVRDRDLSHLVDFVRREIEDGEVAARYVPNYLGWIVGSSLKRGTSYAQFLLEQILTDGGAQTTLRTIERAACAADVRIELPFGDRDYVEHVLGLSAWQRNRPGEPKWILRQAYADALPEPYVTDPIKANFADVTSLALEGRRSGISAMWYVKATWVDRWRQALAEFSA